MCTCSHPSLFYLFPQNKLVVAGQWSLAGVSAKDPTITAAVVESYRKLARYMFDCGDYKAARDMLSYYIALYASPPAPSAEENDEDLIAAGLQSRNTSSSNDRDSNGNPAMYYLKSVNADMMEVLWGRLAGEILVQDWEAAGVAVEAVKSAVESMSSSNQMSSLQALQQRTWLLHWSLFVYWNDAAGLERLVDLFHSEKYRQAVTTNAPHLLRYLTAAVLLCKRRVNKKASGSSSEAKRLLKNLIYVMEDCEYTDPIVEFVNCLCVKFDFDSAQTKLAECEQVLTTDFFLCQQTNLFMEEARVFVFENYCRIHHKIDLKALGDKLAMDQEQAERWIVDLIRNADLDAKIDSTEGCVVMGGDPLSVYEQVMDRTRDLNVRSATLAQNLNSLLNDSRKEKSRKAASARGDEY
jgi:translation initiation factor 3 subunit E